MKGEKLNVSFFGKRAKSPLLLASGILDVSFSSMLRCVESGCGIVTMKSMTLEPRKGHNGPVIAEFPGGMINSMGLSNPGIDAGLKEILDFKKRSDAPLIASIFAVATDEFLSLTRSVNSSQADALELNLSCPNVDDEFGIPLAASKEKVSEIVREVKKISRIPVIAKLSPNTYNVPEIALAAENAGADALTLINTLGPGMLINIEAKKPVILNKYGGISGSALKPIAIKLIYQISKLVKIPIIGMGGILSVEDAIEFLLAGATFLGIGTAVYYSGYEIFTTISNGLEEYISREGLQSVSEIIPID